MSEEVCCNCIYFDRVENGGIVCNRIWPCYTRKTECKYFKPVNQGDKV